MPRILHICLRTDDLAARIIARHHAQAEMETGMEIRVIDLNQPDPDYDALVTALFAADHVAVWT
jgi:hypothetical protein